MLGLFTRWMKIIQKITAACGFASSHSHIPDRLSGEVEIIAVACMLIIDRDFKGNFHLTETIFPLFKPNFVGIFVLFPSRHFNLRCLKVCLDESGAWSANSHPSVGLILRKANIVKSSKSTPTIGVKFKSVRRRNQTEKFST